MKIAFISTYSAIRSIMAEAVARRASKLALLSLEIYSAGVQPAERVPEEVIKLLQEKGYPIEGLYPKGIDSIPYEEIDILITLSPEARDKCPYSENHIRREHWNIEDVKSLRREELLKTLEQIEKQIKELFRIS